MKWYKNIHTGEFKKMEKHKEGYCIPILFEDENGLYTIEKDSNFNPTKRYVNG